VLKVLHSSQLQLSEPTWGAAGTIAWSEGPYEYVGGVAIPGQHAVLTNSDIDGEVIDVMSAQGGTPHFLARGNSPRFSPDGTHLLYLDDGTEGPGGVAPRELGQVHEMRSDGSDDRVVLGTRWTAGGPVYAPDGKSFLLLVSDHPDDDYRIERHDLRTGRLLAYISQPNGNAGAPDEQPLH
jgi:Tol biopolymer transport system component